MAKMSENEEAGIILGSTIVTAATVFASQAPLPAEWKIPIVTFLTAIDGAILAWWRLKVNNPDAPAPT